MANLQTLVPRFDRTYLTIHQIPFEFSKLVYGHVLKSDLGLGYILMDQSGNLLLSGVLFTQYKDASFVFPDQVKARIKHVYILDTRSQRTMTRFVGSSNNFLAGLSHLQSVTITTNIDLYYADTLAGFLSNNPELRELNGLHQLLDDNHVDINNLLSNDPKLISLFVGNGVNLCGKRSFDMFAKCLHLQKLSFGETELSRIDAQTGLDIYAWIPDAETSYFGDDGHVQGVIVNPLINDSNSPQVLSYNTDLSALDDISDISEASQHAMAIEADDITDDALDSAVSDNELSHGSTIEDDALIDTNTMQSQSTDSTEAHLQQLASQSSAFWQSLAKTVVDKSSATSNFSSSPSNSLPPFKPSRKHVDQSTNSQITQDLQSQVTPVTSSSDNTNGLKSESPKSIENSQQSQGSVDTVQSQTDSQYQSKAELSSFQSNVSNKINTSSASSVSKSSSQTFKPKRNQTPNYFMQGYQSVQSNSQPRHQTVVRPDLSDEAVLNSIDNKEYSTLKSQANSINYNNNLASLGNLAAENTQMANKQTNQSRQLVTQLDQSSQSLSQALGAVAQVMDVSLVQSQASNNRQLANQYNQDVTSIAHQVSLASNTIANRQHDFDQLMSYRNDLLSQADTQAKNGFPLNSLASSMSVIGSQASSAYVVASSAADFSKNQMQVNTDNLASLSSMVAWFDDQLQYAYAQRDTQNQTLNSMAQDATEYQHMIGSLITSFAPNSAIVSSANEEIGIGVTDVNSQQSYVTSVATSLRADYNDSDDTNSATSQALDQLLLINAHVNKLSSDQASLAGNVQSATSQADSGSNVLLTARVKASNQVASIAKAADNQQDDLANSLSTKLIDLVDTVQSHVDEMSQAADQVGKYLKLNSANLDTVTNLRSKADSFVDLIAYPASAAIKKQSDAEKTQVSTNLDSTSISNHSNMSMAQSASSSSSDNDGTIGHPGQEYDNFDLQHHVLRDLWGVTTAVTMTLPQGGSIELEPAKHPIFKLLDAQVLADGFKFKIQYQNQIGFIKVEQSDIQPAYYWHGVVMQLAKTVPFKVRINEMTLIHQQLNFKDKDTSRLYLDDVVTVVDMAVYNGVPRFKLSDGTYITTNRYYVSVVH